MIASKGPIPKWCRSCRQKQQRASGRRWYKNLDPEQRRLRWIRYRYGIEPEEAKKLLDKGCAICGSKDHLAIDHCHESGQIRAALCRSCNMMLGNAKDDPKILNQGATYLRSKKQVRVD